MNLADLDMLFLPGTHLFEILTEPSKFKDLRRQISIRITVTVAHTRFKPANAERMLKPSAIYQHTRPLQYMSNGAWKSHLLQLVYTIRGRATTSPTDAQCNSQGCFDPLMLPFWSKLHILHTVTL
jgi:hypothetical protein